MSEQSNPREAMGSMTDDLWMVLAIVKDFKLDAVTRALMALPGFGGMTVSDCRGFGHERLGPEREDVASRAVARDADLHEFKRHLRLEIVVAGHERADAIVDALAHSAHTGRGGDGKVFLWPVTRAVRVRNFAGGAEAL